MIFFCSVLKRALIGIVSWDANLKKKYGASGDQEHLVQNPVTGGAAIFLFDYFQIWCF